MNEKQLEMLLLALAILVANTAAAAATTDYCKLHTSHTLCVHKGEGAACIGGLLGRGVKPAEAKEIVRLHNKLRSRIAHGEEPLGSPGPQPSSSNMLQMVWDNELAMIAQSHADQCVFKHDCYTCRRTSRYSITGQNLFLRGGTGSATEMDMEQAVGRAFYGEVANFNRHAVLRFGSFKSPGMVGHYTQLVWAKTYRVGCGFSRWKVGKWTKMLLTCNYAPGGNTVTVPIYKVGAACSDCPQGSTCSSQFPGLCSKGEGDEPVIITDGGGDDDDLITGGNSAAEASAPLWRTTVMLTFTSLVWLCCLGFTLLMQ